MMQPLPNPENPTVLRTDFSDQIKWETVCRAILKPIRYLFIKFKANVAFMDDIAYQNASIKKIMAITSKHYDHSFIIVADKQTMTTPDSLVLVVDLWDTPGRTFRTTPDQIQGIENNLSLANMDFFEFADHVDEDGVFRGFS